MFNPSQGLVLPTQAKVLLRIQASPSVFLHYLWLWLCLPLVIN